MVTQILIRFLVGGAVVSAFAILGDLLKPKSFAGLFGAAPSVALATLGLTIATEGPSYAATEARSMMAGAVALKPFSLLRKLTLALGISAPDRSSTVPTMSPVVRVWPSAPIASMVPSSDSANSKVEFCSHK